MDRNGERSFVEIFQSIGSNIQQIVRSEVGLAKAELREEAKEVSKAGILLLTGATAGLYAVGLILLALVYVLTPIVSAWIAALLVAFVVAVVGVMFSMAGRRRWRLLYPKPKETIDGARVKENKEWPTVRTT
jgi:uncharacterized membrane protein YqjE